MIESIFSALLPIFVTLVLGFIAAWRHDFGGQEATTLNRMVMLYALPLALFSNMAAVQRESILSQGPLALALFAGLVGSYLIVFAISYFFVERDVSTASLRALAISGPAVAFVGFPVLGELFGAESAIPISIAGLIMNLITVPATLILLSSSGDGAGRGAAVTKPSIAVQILDALKEPVVWAPVAGLLLVLLDIGVPSVIRHGLMLLGSATGGVAMFASGIVLYSRRVALSVPVAIGVVARNIAIPAGLWLLTRLLGWPVPTVREAVLTLAIPTAAIAVILAVQYHKAEQEIASMLFFSTIFSAVTVGGFIWVTA